MDFSVSEATLPKEDELRDLAITFSRNMVKHPTVVDIPAGSSVLYVGDLHGYFDCLEQALQLAEEKNADYVVFLGDYVDRGPKQIETILAITELALRDQKFITLRGNHEDDRMNREYGFYNDLKKVYQDQEVLENVISSFSTIYEFLPLAAIKDGSGSLAVHGGIPQNPDLQLIEVEELVVKKKAYFPDMLDVSEKKGRQNVRLGQKKLRELCLSNYQNQCAFCEVVESNMLVAAHISRWADDEKNRGNLENVISMCRFHDPLFENGYFTLSR